MSTDGGGLGIPGPGSAPDHKIVAFAAELIDRSGQAPVIEAALAHRTGRPRPLPARYSSGSSRRFAIVLNVRRKRESHKAPSSVALHP